jgi:hypothetical protein
MRSDIVFGALAQVTNRYTLCQLASKATRKLHKPTTRIEDTTNEVFVRFHHESPAATSFVAPEASQIENKNQEQRRAA